MLDALTSRVFDLANQMADADKVKAKAAKRELERAAHLAARPGGTKKDRETLIAALLEVVKGEKTYAPVARAHAARLLGFIGGKGEERALAPYEKDAAISDDIYMARERIRRA
jgi:hypothetical protein